MIQGMRISLRGLYLLAQNLKKLGTISLISLLFLSNPCLMLNKSKTLSKIIQSDNKRLLAMNNKKAASLEVFLF
jgi:hypothetical protein